MLGIDVCNKVNISIRHIDTLDLAKQLPQESAGSAVPNVQSLHSVNMEHIVCL